MRDKRRQNKPTAAKQYGYVHTMYVSVKFGPSSLADALFSAERARRLQPISQAAAETGPTRVGYNRPASDGDLASRAPKPTDTRAFNGRAVLSPTRRPGLPQTQHQNNTPLTMKNLLVVISSCANKFVRSLKAHFIASRDDKHACRAAHTPHPSLQRKINTPPQSIDRFRHIHTPHAPPPSNLTID